MKVINITEEAYYQMLHEIIAEVKKILGEEKEKEWILEDEAKEILGIRSRTTLQKLRDNSSITYTQPTRKHVLYRRSSLYEYLEKHSNKPLSSLTKTHKVCQSKK